MSVDLKQVRETVQGELTGTCASVTHKTTGGFLGSYPPPTTIEFDKNITEIIGSNALNSWDMDKLALLVIHDQAMDCYRTTYAGWVNGALAGDAPPSVVAWWENAKVTGV